ncbi:hypothetical protein [Sphingomonas endophytica]|uniref:Uncharacterized protein n=1 Tax=Sphingomonas endophytica TaxID=869719 RepID=A0A147I3N9_9SPHN|nr:hypothetical protein [Sphingomonas endophytica]KTT72624.1 hypothetical protein NS334_08495 [Sphingomonas endophytica]
MDKIKMLVGQEGPGLSRLPGQTLTVGVDVGADEAQRLVDGDLAIDVSEAAPAAPATVQPAPAKPARSKAVKAVQGAA